MIEVTKQECNIMLYKVQISFTFTRNKRDIFCKDSLVMEIIFDRSKAKAIVLVMLIFCRSMADAQSNYEIQVYASPTMTTGSTMFELHSNYTFSGLKEMENGVIPANHSLHETVEITTGISPVFETGVYLFTNYAAGHGYQVVGVHLRPRVAAPSSWNIPFGMSLSAEIGYQKPEYAEETWSLELRPIIDKQWGNFYAALNPTLGIALQSQYNNSVPTFEPNVKLSYTVGKNTALGLEYYGDMGPISDFDQGPQQSHALFLSYDLLNNAKWELNIGTGFGVTKATDPFVFKIITGRKVQWKKHLATTNTQAGF